MRLAQWLAEGDTFEFRGHRLFQRSEGAGAALLLIHGFPTSSYDWSRLWPALAGRHRLLAIDMLGFGLSDKPADFDYRIAASADQWVAAALAQGIAEAHVLAHDYGDTVAQELLARQNEGSLPLRIRSMAFLNGGLFPEASFPLRLQKLLLGPLGPLVARLANQRSFERSMRRICAQALDPIELGEHWQLLLRSNGRRILPRLIGYIRERREQRGRWVSALQQAGIPLCLINGVEDPISGASIVRRWRELLPGRRVVELPGVGHYPQMEDANAVLAAVTEFFESAVAGHD